MSNRIQKELARLQRYDEELSKEMPSDFKDWWENSKEEWPLIARLVLEDRRKNIELSYDIFDKQVQEFKELYEYTKELEEKIKELEEEKTRLELLSWETIADYESEGYN